MMTTTTTTATNSSTAGYAPDAAWLAIRRHMQSSSFDDLTVISLKTNVFFFQLISSLSLDQNQRRSIDEKHSINSGFDTTQSRSTFIHWKTVKKSSIEFSIEIKNKFSSRRNLRQYEQHLAYLALETNEASSTLSSCLFELYN